MKHQLSITLDDQLTFQLYEASTNPLKVRNRRKSYVCYIGLAALFALIFYLIKNDFLFYYCLFITLLAILFGKTYLKWYHKRHYTKHVKEVYKISPADQTEIEILEEQISSADKTGTSSINISEIEIVNEISGHYLVRLSTGPVLIIPKNNTALNEEVLAMIKKHNIPHLKQLDWKW